MRGVCSVLHWDHARVIISNVYVAMRYLQVYFFVVFVFLQPIVKE